MKICGLHILLALLFCGFCGNWVNAQDTAISYKRSLNAPHISNSNSNLNRKLVNINDSTFLYTLNLYVGDTLLPLYGFPTQYQLFKSGITVLSPYTPYLILKLIDDPFKSIKDITTDNYGNIYLTGEISRSDIIGGNIIHVPYYAKLSPNGSVIWARMFRGTQFESMANNLSHQIFISPDGNAVYLINHYFEMFNNVSSVVLTKMDRNGLPLWSKKWNQNGIAKGTVLKNNQIQISSYFSEDPYGTEFISLTSILDSNGNPLLSKSWKLNEHGLIKKIQAGTAIQTPDDSLLFIMDVEFNSSQNNKKGILWVKTDTALQWGSMFFFGDSLASYNYLLGPDSNMYFSVFYRNFNGNNQPKLGFLKYDYSGHFIGGNLENDPQSNGLYGDVFNILPNKRIQFLRYPWYQYLNFSNRLEWGQTNAKLEFPCNNIPYQPRNIPIDISVTPAAFKGQNIQAPVQFTSIVFKDTFIGQFENQCLKANISKPPCNLPLKATYSINCEGNLISLKDQSAQHPYYKKTRSYWVYNQFSSTHSDSQFSYAVTNPFVDSVWLIHESRFLQYTCIDTLGIKINIPSKNTRISCKYPPATCVNQAVNMVYTGDPASHKTFKWTVENASINEFIGSQIPTFYFNKTGTHKVLLTVYDSCVADSWYTFIEVMPEPIADAGPDTALCRNILFIPKIKTQIHYQYLWEPENFWNQRNMPIPTAQLTDTTHIRVRVRDSLGCISWDSARIIALPCDCKIHVPNAFTPGGNELNETYQVFSDCPFNRFEIRIFNRWGQQIFYSENPSFKWDGTYMGLPVPNGAYPVEIRVISPFFNRGFRYHQALVIHVLR